MRELARQADARAHAPQGRSAAEAAARRCARTTSASAATTACYHPDFYDRDLRRLFSDAPQYAGNMKAARFIARIRRDVRRMVASWTGEYQYTIDQVIENDDHARANELNLRLTGPEDATKLDFLVMLTVQTMNYLHSGRHRVAL